MSNLTGPGISFLWCSVGIDRPYSWPPATVVSWDPSCPWQQTSPRLLGEAWRKNLPQYRLSPNSYPASQCHLSLSPQSSVGPRGLTGHVLVHSGCCENALTWVPVSHRALCSSVLEVGHQDGGAGIFTVWWSPFLVHRWHLSAVSSRGGRVRGSVRALSSWH